MFSNRNKPCYLPVRGGVSSSNMLQEKLRSTPQAVHRHYKSKLIQAHRGDIAFLSSKYHCPLNWTLKIITLKLKPKQSRLFSVLNSSLKLRLDCTGKGCTDVTIKAKKSVLHYLCKTRIHNDTNDQLSLNLLPQNTPLSFSHTCHLQQY